MQLRPGHDAHPLFYRLHARPHPVPARAAFAGDFHLALKAGAHVAIGTTRLPAPRDIERRDAFSEEYGGQRFPGMCRHWLAIDRDDHGCTALDFL